MQYCLYRQVFKNEYSEYRLKPMTQWEICIRIKRVSVSNTHTLVGMGSCHNPGLDLWQRPGWPLLGSRRTLNTAQGCSCHRSSTSHSALPEAARRTQSNPTSPKRFPAVATGRNLSGSQWTAQLYTWTSWTIIKLSIQPQKLWPWLKLLGRECI